MQAIIVLGVLLVFHGFAFTASQEATIQYRGKMVQLKPGMSPLEFAIQRGPPPPVATPRPRGPDTNATELADDDDLPDPEGIKWGFIDEEGIAHGHIDLAWVYEGIPSWDGVGYNSVSEDTRRLWKRLAELNANITEPERDYGQPTSLSLGDERDTKYACHSNHAARNCDCVDVRNHLMANPYQWQWVDGDMRAAQSILTCSIVVNTNKPGWTGAYWYQMVADATPIIDNCWDATNPCLQWRSGVSQGSNRWAKTCVCGVDWINKC